MDAPDPRGLSSSDLLDGLEQRSAREVRSLRDACRNHESGISFRRRVVQGRLDIARAERERRSGTSEAALVDGLAGILADQPTGSRRETRAVFADVPEGVDTSDLPSINDLPDLDHTELEERIAALQARERELSTVRRVLLDNLDALQVELVARYRDGRADIAEVVSSWDADESSGDEPTDG